MSPLLAAIIALMKQPPQTLPDDTAIARYQAIAAYIALDPPRGQRRQLLEQLAQRLWTWPDGSQRRFSAETLRAWVRRYRTKGLDGLRDAPRSRPGVSTISTELQLLACELKREVPERSLDRMIRILEQTGAIEAGELSRSTLHRVLQAEGISQRPPSDHSRRDLDRFEAAAPNDLWQSDMLEGPWLEHPLGSGKKRRAHLFAYLDDHSRKLLHGRFAFKGNLPALELVYRRCLQKYGVPRRNYYDNGKVYRAKHIKQINAHVGSQGIAFTTPYRPEGHGKIEALNRLIRSAFIAELKASNIRTLDELNEAFLAWADYEYNRRVHSEIGETPDERWRRGLDNIVFADEEALRQAFLWRERRTADKTGVFSLFGTKYQVGSNLARRRVEVRYDPEALEQVEIWLDGEFQERVSPLRVRSHRRPRAQSETDAATVSEKPAVDWLEHLVRKRREEGFIETDPRKVAQLAALDRRRERESFLTLFEDRLEPDVVDHAALRVFFDKHSPLVLDEVASVLDATLEARGRRDQHITFYLDAIHHHLFGRSDSS